MMIGEKIRQAREAKGLSQEYVAEQLGISQASYSNIERGETSPNIKRLMKLGEVLEIDIADLLYEEKGITLYINNNHGTITEHSAQTMTQSLELALQVIASKNQEITTLKEMLATYKELIERLTQK
ncbi:MAG: helix-turn-helix transcriptional regulator [Bacteroidetes bacterium]|nr:helix-turn-helix transcriptional regulator [Bacteroidota bacterium]